MDNKIYITELKDKILEIERYEPTNDPQWGDYIPRMESCEDGDWIKLQDVLNLLNIKDED